MTMTMITRPVIALRASVVGPWLHPCLAKKKLALCKSSSSKYSCSNLVPLGIKSVLEAEMWFTHGGMCR